MTRYEDLRRMREAKFAAEKKQRADSRVERAIVRSRRGLKGFRVHYKDGNSDVGAGKTQEELLALMEYDKPDYPRFDRNSVVRVEEVPLERAEEMMFRPPVTKPVTKPVPVPAPVKGGRPSLFDRPMTAAEKMRRYRARRKAIQEWKA